jgi:S1-C subfamily serine protease
VVAFPAAEPALVPDPAAALPLAIAAADGGPAPAPDRSDGPQSRGTEGATRRARRPLSLWSTLIPLTIFLGLILLAAYAAPALWLRWRLAVGEGEAEAAYLKREAELKAEAEAADKRLDLLDRRTHLVSLGFRELVRKVTPAVVNIIHYQEARADDLAPHARRNLYHDADTDRNYVQTGVGSGLIVKPGFVLTNNHVVKGAQRLRVTFASGRSVRLDMSRVAADPLTDLAVLRLPENPPENLRRDYEHSAVFADSDKDVERGDLVVAVGSPLGLERTVTHGIISAKGRLLSRHEMVELLQTDTPINPGNSGGPLFDLHGRVVGINVAIISDTGRSQGIGLVIPSNTAREVFAKLADKGEVVRGFIGAILEDVTPEDARALGLGDGGGVRIHKVMPGSPAARGGLKAGDVIVRFNKETLGSENAFRELRQHILDTPIGRSVALEVLRSCKRRTLTVEIGKRPNL